MQNKMVKGYFINKQYYYLFALYCHKLIEASKYIERLGFMRDFRFYGNNSCSGVFSTRCAYYRR